MKKVLFTATVDSHILHFHIPFLKQFKENGYEVHVATNGDEEIPFCDKKIKISFERSPYSINNLKAIKELKKVINEVIDNTEYVLKDKDRIVRVLRHSDSSITYAVKVWVKSEDYWTTHFDLQENIKEAFDKNKIEIPYPQIDIHQK